MGDFAQGDQNAKSADGVTTWEPPIAGWETCPRKGAAPATKDDDQGGD